MSEFEFNIIDNLLESEDDRVLPFLILSNKYYDVQIMYSDNYKKDKQANKIQKNMICANCSPKRNLVKLKYIYSGGVFVDVNYRNLIELNRIDNIKNDLSKLKEDLDIAEQSGKELQKIINEYFLKYTTE